MSGAVTAYLGLGANLGDREQAIRGAGRALDRRGDVEVLALSRIVETAPDGGPPQGAYLNAAAAVRTSLPARDLLEVCLALERARGRERRRERRWGPRPLDIDLLLYGDAVIDEPGLRVPHPRLHERAFVLGPLAEIAGAVVHPVLGRSIESLRAEVARADAEAAPSAPPSRSIVSGG